MPTVLVVDDEQLIRWSLSERLTAEGCTVMLLADGEWLERALSIGRVAPDRGRDV